MEINEQAYIELYNGGKSILELSKIFNMSRRCVERYEEELRCKGRIKYRKELVTSKSPSIDDGKPIVEPVNWEITKTKKKMEKGGEVKKYLVIGDLHIPYQNTPAIRGIHSLMEDINFEGFICLGDFMDLAPISHWNKNKKLTLEMKRLKEDYIAGNKLLDAFDKRLPKGCDKRFFYGNHEDWYNTFIEEMPVLEGLLDPKNELKLVERGYIVYDQLNHKEKLGRLWLTHGMYHTANFVKKHLESFASNVLVAHLHTPRLRFAPSAVKEIALAGYAIGCLCDLNPDYLRNRPRAWSHGFGVIHLFPDGFFDVHLIRIVKGRFIYNDKVYNGNTEEK